ncbi:MAG: protein-L-isoaspartate O-methyltransferase [Spirochaetia bacterium]
MEPGKPCPVCGYSPVSSAHGAQSAAKPSGNRRRTGTLLALLLSAGGLLLLLAAFLLTTELRREPAAEQAQAAAPAPEGATPAPEVASPPAETPAEPPSGTAAADSSVTPPAASAVVDAPRGTVAAAAPPSPPAAPRPAPAPTPIRAPAPVSAASGPVLLSVDEPPYDIATRTDLPPFSDREAFVDWMVQHTDQKAKFLKARWDRAQIIQRLGNYTHDRVREAFLLTPREYFARDPRRAYENAVLPIGYGQTISGPHLVSRMTDYLDPQPEQKVLEIGTGSGYQSALLSEISNHVFTIEIVEKLARETDAIYRRLEPRYPEYRNIKRKVDDGYYGWEEYAPFDRIIVTCGIDHVPPALIRQLAPGGIMVIPIGPPSGQTILRIIKKVAADGTVSLEREDIYHGKKKQIFVPFTARGGGVHRADDQKD